MTFSLLSIYRALCAGVNRMRTQLTQNFNAIVDTQTYQIIDIE